MLIKTGLQAFYQQRSGCVIYYPGIASTAEVPGTPYRMSGTLEFSLCASIAPDRRPLSECAKRTSLGRRSGNRRRSARSTKFHSVSAVLYDRPGTSDLIWFYEANFIVLRSGYRCRVEDAHVVVESVLIAVRLLCSACHIQDHVEDLLADICDGFLTGSYITGRDVDHVEPVIL